MPDIISIRGSNTTPKGYLDTSRPLVMVDADNIYKKLSVKEGNSPADTISFLTKLTAVLKSTNSSKLEQLWPAMEKVFNDEKTIEVKAKTDEGKMQTAAAMFYSALDNIDALSTTTAELHQFRNLFFEIRNHIDTRVLPGQSGKDLRNLARVLDTTTKRMDKVIERFNARVDAGELPGVRL